MTQATIQDNSVSFVYAWRLNSVMLRIAEKAPEMKMTTRLMKEKDLSFTEALEIAKKEHTVFPLPQCLHSANEDGTTNISWIGGIGTAGFYTIDAEGMAVCKEYPDEHLDLSDYGWLLGVAATIYCDLSVSDIESDGLRALLQLWQEEPEWVGDHALTT